MKDRSRKLGTQAAWAMAVGGMIGGGMFAVLGTILHVAGTSAWLSFLFAGVLASLTGVSYARLSGQMGHAGGLYRFLRADGHILVARIAIIVLVGAYTLSIAVYGYTFGAYIKELWPGAGGLGRGLAVASIGLIAVMNLRHIKDVTRFEIVAVWGQLAIFGLLAGIAFIRGDPARLSGSLREISDLVLVPLGAATAFMAFQGFQLLAYDYDDLTQPPRVLPRAIQAACVTTTVAYIVITLGAIALIGVEQIVSNRTVSLSVFGEAALGSAGFYLILIAAAFATLTAINATLFATARLVGVAAQDGDLPRFLARRNRWEQPFSAVLGLGSLACILALLGGLGGLIRSASLLFLIVFSAVNFIAWQKSHFRSTIPALGFLGTSGCALLLALDMSGLIFPR